MEGPEVQTLLQLIAALAGAIIGSAASLIATTLTLRHEQKRFIRERLWDERRASYQNLTSQLQAIVALTRQINRDTQNGEAAAAYLASHRFRDDDSRLRELEGGMRLALADSKLAMSPSVSCQAYNLVQEIETVRGGTLSKSDLYPRLADIYMARADELIEKMRQEVFPT